MIDKKTYRITYKQAELIECFVKAKNRKEALKKFENNEGYDYEKLDGSYIFSTNIPFKPIKIMKIIIILA